MGALPNYYRILHVQPDAPPAIVHASYRALLERARAAGAAAHELAALDEAYAVLGDAARRAAYDVRRSEHAPLDETAASPHLEPDPGAIAAGSRTCLFCGALHDLKRIIEPDDECGRCGSPLFPAERHRLEYSGQRVLNRIPKQTQIEICVTWPQAAPIVGEMRDVSLNGMQFAAPLPLQPSQVLRIDCPELRALARVAHTHAEGGGRWVTGVEFLTLRFRRARGSFVSERV